MYGTTVLLPVMVQSLMGYTAQWAGMVLSPGGLLTMIVMPIAGRLLSKVEPRWLVITGLLILATGMYRLSMLSLQTGFWTLVLTWSISRSGLPLLFIPINVTVFAHVPRERTGSATGLLNLTRNLGGSVGISLVTVAQTRLAQVHQSILAGHMTPLDSSFTSRIAGLQRGLMANGSDAAQAGAQANAVLYGELLRQSTMLSYIDVFRILSGLCLLLIPMMLLMKRVKPGARPVPAEH
jgi:DHA2 family multidrug resistance protein